MELFAEMIDTHGSHSHWFLRKHDCGEQNMLWKRNRALHVILARIFVNMPRHTKQDVIPAVYNKPGTNVSILARLIEALASDVAIWLEPNLERATSIIVGSKRRPWPWELAKLCERTLPAQSVHIRVLAVLQLNIPSNTRSGIHGALAI